MKRDGHRSKQMRLLATIGLGLAMLLALPGMVRRYQVGRELARVRSAGEPVTNAELAEFYRVPLGELDSTGLWCAVAKELSVELGATLSLAVPIPPTHQSVDLDQARLIVETYEPSRSLIHRASRSGGAARYPIDLNDGVHTRLPHIAGLQNAVTLMLLEAQVAIADGDAAQAARAIEAAAAVTYSLRYEPCAIVLWIRARLDEYPRRTMLALLDQLEPPDDDLERLQATLRRTDYLDHLERAYQGDRAMYFEAMTDPASVDINLADRVMLALSRSITPLDHLRRVRLQLEQCRSDPWGSLPSSPTPEGFVIHFPQRHLPFGSLWSEPADAATLMQQIAYQTAQHRGADAALAIARYRQREGRLPDQLDDLVPKLLPEVPLDPFSGRPLVYEVESESAFRVHYDWAPLAGNDEPQHTTIRLELP